MPIKCISLNNKLLNLIKINFNLLLLNNKKLSLAILNN